MFLQEWWRGAEGVPPRLDDFCRPQFFDLLPAVAEFLKVDLGVAAEFGRRAGWHGRNAVVLDWRADDRRRAAEPLGVLVLLFFAVTLVKGPAVLVRPL